MKKIFVIIILAFSACILGCGSDKSSSSPNSPSQTNAEKTNDSAQAKQDESQQKEPQKDNPYEAYKNGDKGIIGYMYWYTIEKMPKIEQSPTCRKLLPYDGLISDEEMKEITFKKASREKRVTLLLQEAYEVDEKGPYLYYSNLVFSIIAKVVDGKIVPVYIGQLDSGRYNGYGILFATERFKIQGKNQYITYVKYEGTFNMNSIGVRNKLGGFGYGILYEISFPDPDSSLPHIKASSGGFVDGQKHGYFIEYDGEELVYEGDYKDGKKAQ